MAMIFMGTGDLQNDTDYFTSILNALAMNARISERSSIIFEVGLPAPCPALVSMRMSLGASPVSAACIVAAYLKLCAGTTRSSWSAVVTSTGGYFFPHWIVFKGEEAYSAFEWPASSDQA